MQRRGGEGERTGKVEDKKASVTAGRTGVLVTTMEQVLSYGEIGKIEI